MRKLSTILTGIASGILLASSSSYSASTNHPTHPLLMDAKEWQPEDMSTYGLHKKMGFDISEIDSIEEDTRNASYIINAKLLFGDLKFRSSDFARWRGIVLSADRRYNLETELQYSTKFDDSTKSEVSEISKGDDLRLYRIKPKAKDEIEGLLLLVTRKDKNGFDQFIAAYLDDDKPPYDMKGSSFLSDDKDAAIVVNGAKNRMVIDGRIKATMLPGIHPYVDALAEEMTLEENPDFIEDVRRSYIDLIKYIVRKQLKDETGTLYVK